MDKDSKIAGIAWRYDGYPNISEYNAFISSPEAVLKIVFTDGHTETANLEIIPHSPVWDEHDYVLPFLLRAGDIERWEAPKQVAILRLRFADGGRYWIDMKAFAQKR